jgi:hypothetical protein
MKRDIDKWHTEVRELRDLGIWMRETLPEGTVISTYANGAISYEAGAKLTVIDQLGLTDEHIAREGKRRPAGTAAIGHTAYDTDYVINVRKPDVVFVTGKGYYPKRTCDLVPEYAERYRPASFVVVGTESWVLMYLRKDRADQLLPMLSTDPKYQFTPCP